MPVTDIDLLAIEPALFTDAQSAAIMLDDQTNASIAGSTLTSAGSAFDTIGVDKQRVAVIEDEPHEITALIDATNVTISKPRGMDGTMIPPKAGTNLALRIVSFERIVDASTLAVRRAFDVLASDPVDPIDDAQILNMDQLDRLIALHAAARAFDTASAAAPAEESLSRRAAIYATLRDEAARQTTLVIDLDGDGMPDAARRIAAGPLRR